LPYQADLPSEVEWEYACRAGTDAAFHDGSNLTNERDDAALNAIAVYSRGSGAQDAPSPVAKRKANAWGLYDMQGNVAEWVYGIRGRREPVLRGGSW
jgi:formylglycine-generating enzyme required for sulfatase activity